jgi:3'(2'), 5'-bisphosphate nucleotidase
MTFEAELRSALEAASDAGELIRDDYVSFVAIPNAPASITTQTDRNAQEVILKYLQSAFPDDAFCAEEATETLQRCALSGKRIWIVDPIDGTRGFAKKNGEFSVMIGLLVNGTLESPTPEWVLAVGVVLEPAKERVTFARRGGGCWTRTGLNGPRQCRVSGVAKLSESLLIQSHSKPGEISAPMKSLQPRRVIETYSAGVKLAMVARGEGELYVNTYPNFHDWDICAGHLLVTEAGGNVTALNGEGIRYCQPNNEQRGGLLATNGLVHGEAVKMLKGKRGA